MSSGECQKACLCIWISCFTSSSAWERFLVLLWENSGCKSHRYRRTFGGGGWAPQFNECRGPRRLNTRGETGKLQHLAEVQYSHFNFTGEKSTPYPLSESPISELEDREISGFPLSFFFLSSNKLTKLQINKQKNQKIEEGNTFKTISQEPENQYVEIIHICLWYRPVFHESFTTVKDINNSIFHLTIKIKESYAYCSYLILTSSFCSILCQCQSNFFMII